MTNTAPKLNWCKVRLGNDGNWWVKEISDPVHWDIDGLSILDPNQVAYVIELMDNLKEYGFQMEFFENAFFNFRISKKEGEDLVRLIRCEESLLESEEKLFALPDIVDEENGAYADLLDHITRVRIKMLNESIKFERKLSAEEVEEEIREKQSIEFFDGKGLHAFRELVDLLEYMPEGYSLSDEEIEDVKVKEGYEDIDIEDTESGTIEEDETMRWDDIDDIEPLSR